jgi:hypothetical protein
MAKYNILRKCGHEEAVEIYGPVKDRDWKAAREAKKLCSACYRAEQIRKAQEASQAAGLPELTGTPKQVAWAEQIRARVIQDLAPLKEMLEKAVAAGNENAPTGLRIIDSVLGRTEAREWIETRDIHYSAEWLVNETKKALGQ